MNIAICFFGQVKNFSVDLYNNYISNIYDKVQVFSHDYFLITWNNKHIDNPRNRENIDIDYTSILPFFNFVKTNILDIDSDCTKTIDAYSDLLVSKYGGSWGENSILSTRFGLRQPYSLQIMKQEFEQYPIKYDKYILLRPDLWFNSPLPTDCLNKNYDLCIPDFDSYGGYNDRFAVTSYNGMLAYCNRYRAMLSESKKYHSENFLKEYTDKQNINIKKIDNFTFQRVRSGHNTQ